MTNPAIQYGSQIAADTRSGPSPSIWGNCPILEILTQTAGGVSGKYFYDDFTDIVTITSPTTDALLDATNHAPIYGFGSSGSTITQGTDDELILTSAATNNLGGSVSMRQNPWVISNVSGELWFEARIRTSTITTLDRAFIIGLQGVTTPAITTPLAASGGTMEGAVDFVGFEHPEGDTTTYDTTHQAGGQTQVVHDNGVGALAIDTYVKLGMHFNINGDSKVHFYTNGVEHPTAHTVVDALGTSFPSDIGLRLIYAYINGTGAAAATSSMDWWRVAQVAA